MKLKVHSNFYDGDELEYIGPNPKRYEGRTLRAFYSELYTPMHDERSVSMTVRWDDFDYVDNHDCHTMSVSKITLAQKPYDPTQAGDKEDDI